MKTKITALIPARLQASRFPEKLLQVLEGKSVLRRTYEAVQQSGLFDEVIVVCDADALAEEIRAAGGQVMMSRKEHESGTDRIVEAAADLQTDIIVNVQGDEPFISPNALAAIIHLFDRPEVVVGSLMLAITDPQRIADPNRVKVVVDHQQRAMYFSRAPIPYNRENGQSVQAYQHVGVYAFRRETLLKFPSLPASRLEQIEKLENLRWLENGIPVHLALTEEPGISIDTPEDLERARQYIRQQEKLI